MTGARGGALALLSALLTTVGHQAAGGTLPDLALLVVLLPLLCGVVVALAERTTGIVGAVTMVTAPAVVHADAAVAAVRATPGRVLSRRPVPLPARRPLPVAVPAAPAAGRSLAGALAAVDVRRGPPVRC